MDRRIRRRARLLLWMHLFVCAVWLFLFRSRQEPPGWMIHVFLWSILAVQFTWGYTVGLLVGPSRKRRPLLWWSLLTIFMPLYLIAPLCTFIAFHNAIVALGYFLVFVMILACETYCGVMQGAKAHGLDRG
ncbi:MAG TPA: hypothetical protein VKT77_10810 [Chthonomonadaceae bacterium]|nr:hypothetical protein [Chthonomonadaceae bacterium]